MLSVKMGGPRRMAMAARAIVWDIGSHQQDHKYLSNFLALLSAFRVVDKRKRSDKSNKSHK
jgi:hypothetical protein